MLRVDFAIFEDDKQVTEWQEDIFISHMIDYDSFEDAIEHSWIDTDSEFYDKNVHYRLVDTETGQWEEIY